MQITEKFGLVVKIIFIMLICASAGLIMTAKNAVSEQGLNVIKLDNEGYERDRAILS